MLVKKLKGQVFFDFLDMQQIEKRLHVDAFPFSQNLMWDYPLEDIDLKKHKSYIIERVIVRGRLSDFYVMLQIYTTDEIVFALKKSKELDPKMAHFCSQYFNIPKEDIYVSLYYCD